MCWSRAMPHSAGPRSCAMPHSAGTCPALCRIARDQHKTFQQKVPALCRIARDHGPALCRIARDHDPALCKHSAGPWSRAMPHSAGPRSFCRVDSIVSDLDPIWSDSFVDSDWLQSGSGSGCSILIESWFGSTSESGSVSKIKLSSWRLFFQFF
jgi:hypothetical protein